MSTQWLIAKYIPDMSRHEPRNIGVILLKDGKPYLRFRGRTTDGNVDGRKVRGYQNSLENYKAWIAHWERASETGSIKDLMIGANPNCNFFLEFGGERILGADTVEPETLANQLFHQLVGDEAMIDGEPKNETAIDRIFKRLDITEKVEPDVVLPGTIDAEPVFFDFRYRNGRNTWMKRVRIDRGSDKKAMEPLYSAAWVFERARNVDTGCHLVALLDCQDGASITRPEEFLRKHGDAVFNVADEDGSADGLKAMLGLNGALAII
jgi:hypothetical protein